MDGQARRLILMRHAKSAWDAGAPDDHSRPLNGRGRRDAPRMGEVLRTRGWVPELVLCSDATRTRETWARMRDALVADQPVEVRLMRELYHAGPLTVRAAMTSIPDTVRSALILWHNPGVEDTVAWATGLSHRVTTGNAALLEGPEGAGWRLPAGAWRLVDLVRPRDLQV
ncbi:MAG: histidine phosphatase family protein [Alphaproteobacteria bacterium]|nr:histidine phosphatase family protein [Alphaproteobacteria bacterium]